MQTRKGNYSLFPLGIMHFTTTHVMHEHMQLAQAEIFQIKWHKGPKPWQKTVSHPDVSDYSWILNSVVD